MTELAVKTIPMQVAPVTLVVLVALVAFMTSAALVSLKELGDV